MEIRFFLFFFYSFLIVLSTIGYGFIFKKIFFKNNLYLNLSLIGFFGLLTLYIISSITHIFLPHNFFHNILLHLIGILSIFYFRNKISKSDLKIVLIIFTSLFLGYIISKTNEDFPYYHLPMSLQIAQQKLQFGTGNINIAYNHFSSLFHINSLFYLPGIKFYLFNLTNYLFQIFFFSGLIILLKEKKIPDLVIILVGLTLIVFLSKFNRLSEYGADIAGQLLALYSFIFCLIAYFRKKILPKENLFHLIEISFYFSIFAVTTKILYVIYFILPLIISLRIFKFKDLLIYFLNLRFLTVSIFCVLSLIFYNFSSSGCLLYPISITCFYDTVSWSLSEDTINLMRSHYNAWSKGVIGAGYGVNDLGNFINNLTWIKYWIEKYFFTKVTDFIALLVFISIVFYIIFFKNFKKKSITSQKKDFYLYVYIPIIIVLLIWFFNFPTLRYAGYTIVFLFFGIPLCIFFNDRIKLNDINLKKKFTVILIISVIIFNLRNIHRINDEISLNKNQHHNFGNFPYYWIKDVQFSDYKTQSLKLNIVEKGNKCWATPAVCITAEGIDAKEVNNYIIYYIK
tara:strand:+ start:1086 stop:2792 length:1707 start_codon:yes stop_codon:yes gene_type:complete